MILSSNLLTVPDQFPIPQLLTLPPFLDCRGSFIKLFSSSICSQFCSSFSPVESFCSFSHQSVFRGFHFQTPPYAHNKLVTCVSGAVIDFVLNLRKSSSTFGFVTKYPLSPNGTNTLFIPQGYAHAFYAESPSLLIYNVDSEYHSDFDKGILWSSLNYSFSFPSDPIISVRDLSFPSFSSFDSPF